VIGHAPDVAEEDQLTDSLKEVVSLARGAIEQEFQISERLDAKARSQVTLAGQWFAVVQAVSAVAFAAKGVEGWLLYTVGGTAIVGGALLALVFIESAKVWRIRPEGAVSPQGILDLKETAKAGDVEALDDSITHYASILQDRRRTNKLRADALEDAEVLWFLAMAAPLVQLAFALAARLFG
jgi:hypothetical protein